MPDAQRPLPLLLRGLAPALAALLTIAGGCADDARGVDAALPPPVAFDTAPVRIVTATDTIRLTVELATRPEQHAHGLMDRTMLPDDAGMLFLFPETRPATATFWMYRTPLPLDIAYADSGGTIVATLTMQPCASPEPRWCDHYPAGVPYRVALEVNAGYLDGHGIRTGDRILLADVAGDGL